MSNKFKGTPGPWVSDQNGLSISVIAEMENGGWQHVCCCDYGSSNPEKYFNLNKANAQLTSLAPDMLEALSHCVEVLKQMPIASEYVETVGNMCMNYEALITRATTI